MKKNARAYKAGLIAVSNRLPIALARGEDGAWRVGRGSGGLVTALTPVLQQNGGAWIGWSGEIEASGEVKRALARARRKFRYLLHPLTLTRKERDQFYYGFCNEVLWPMFHDLQTLCNFDPTYWKAYLEVNRKFARVVADNCRDGAYIWVHDYHLMNAGGELKDLSVGVPVLFYLHTPFPPLDVFLKLPWRLQILRALLRYDLVGFQTRRDLHNFLHCIRSLIPEAIIREKDNRATIHTGGGKLRAGAFPISIDYGWFEKQAAQPEVIRMASAIRADLRNRWIILGVDRLDYTKGIPYRLRAFRNALERFPDLRQKVSFVQIVAPSRENIPRYNDLKRDIERLVGQVNGRFTEFGWVPIHYIYRNLERPELLAYYRASQMTLVTPLKDGMNLVVKEYCVSNLEEEGAVILSEFAGAATQLGEALLVNPYDIEGVADTIYRTWKMRAPERLQRMRKLRSSIRRHDVYHWLHSFLKMAPGSGTGAKRVGRLEG